GAEPMRADVISIAENAKRRLLAIPFITASALDGLGPNTLNGQQTRRYSQQSNTIHDTSSLKATRVVANQEEIVINYGGPPRPRLFVPGGTAGPEETIVILRVSSIETGSSNHAGARMRISEKRFPQAKINSVAKVGAYRNVRTIFPMKFPSFITFSASAYCSIGYT